MTLADEVARKVAELLDANGASFRELAHIAGYVQERDFIAADLSGVDFEADDLSGFDFREANLIGANLSEAQNVKFSMLSRATVDSSTSLPPKLQSRLKVLFSFWAKGCPSFVSTFGVDEFGQWFEFEIEGRDGPVTQRMRWIAPTEENKPFLMGSPKGEAERADYEGPQHEVTIGAGFWLFDTACTQALWTAVMGKNPSEFKGEDRPVEQVSWNDAQTFIAKINARIPGLNLSLPSEAQWEYACRAGTATPFSFGEDITPDQANYDGDHPYRGGKKGLYRQETVAAGSLPANPWGLYEMHGNVWEWCADAWHDDYNGAPRDGSVWESEDKAVHRVVRGGSWDRSAQHVRSAYWAGPSRAFGTTISAFAAPEFRTGRSLRRRGVSSVAERSGSQRRRRAERRGR